MLSNMRDVLGDKGRNYINSCIKIHITQNTDREEETIESGSGFFISGYFIITNKHVIDEIENDNMLPHEQNKKILHISNKLISSTNVTILYSDAICDLALLFSPDAAKIAHEQKIEPVKICLDNIKCGQEIFAFGYPATYHGESALMTIGYVSGEKDASYGKPAKAILNCPLNHGNSGGPIMGKTSNEDLLLVGVASKKHFMALLPPAEQHVLELIKKSPELQGMTYEYKDEQEAIHKVNIDKTVVKLVDALETHTQLGISEAIYSKDMVNFLSDALLKIKFDTLFKEKIDLDVCKSYAIALINYLLEIIPESAEFNKIKEKTSAAYKRLNGDFSNYSAYSITKFSSSPINSPPKKNSSLNDQNKGQESETLLIKPDNRNKI